jgi:hypothetical protein
VVMKDAPLDRWLRASSSLMNSGLSTSSTDQQDRPVATAAISVAAVASAGCSAR